MIHNDPNDPMPDRMSMTVTVAGYTLGVIVIVLMFVFALPATDL